VRIQPDRRKTLAYPARVLPYTPDQAAEWAQRSPEPIVLDLPDWTRAEHAPPSVPNLKVTIWERGRARIEMARHWDQPLVPGRPMVTASTRNAVVAGHTEEIHKTSMFEGGAMEVEVLFLEGPGWAVRFVFDECAPEIVDDVCARIAIVP
jgi:hypothetical protein